MKVKRLLGRRNKDSPAERKNRKSWRTAVEDEAEADAVSQVSDLSDSTEEEDEELGSIGDASEDYMSFERTLRGKHSKACKAMSVSDSLDKEPNASCYQLCRSLTSPFRMESTTLRSRSSSRSFRISCQSTANDMSEWELPCTTLPSPICEREVLTTPWMRSKRPLRFARELSDARIPK